MTWLTGQGIFRAKGNLGSFLEIAVYYKNKILVALYRSIALRNRKRDPPWSLPWNLGMEDKVGSAECSVQNRAFISVGRNKRFTKRLRNYSPVGPSPGNFSSDINRHVRAPG